MTVLCHVCVGTGFGMGDGRSHYLATAKKPTSFHLLGCRFLNKFYVFICFSMCIARQNARGMYMYLFPCFAVSLLSIN